LNAEGGMVRQRVLNAEGGMVKQSAEGIVHRVDRRRKAEIGRQRQT
jgi:hypothetical protein